ncbi:MAG TPA: Uma2 family endonuclease [Kofleriaceae bacterium]
MRAVWLSVPESFLEQRRAWGQDKLDELWDGELHMVPPPSSRHARIERDLLLALDPIARRRGLEAFPDSTGVFGPGENWRIPDVTLVRPQDVSERGLEAAELVVEVLSPHDESRQKMPWYASIGVTEAWLVHPSTREVEVYTLVERTWHAVASTPAGIVSPLLGIRLEVIAGPKLRLHDGDTFTDV